MNTDVLIGLFSSDKTLATIQQETDIDQRKIRKLWRDQFGDKAVRTRGRRLRQAASVSRCRLDISDDDFETAIVQCCGNTEDVAQLLHVSRSYVQQRVIHRPHLHDMTLACAAEQRATTMRQLRQPFCLSQVTIDSVLSMADPPQPVAEIAARHQISSNSVRNIFKRHMDVDQYTDWLAKMKKLQRQRVFEALERTGQLGSKPENKFHSMVLAAVKTNIIHHDLSLLAPYEIDITIPAIRIAIMWDGIGHFRPVFGQKMLKKVRCRDMWKRRTLRKMGWTVFVVKDLNSRMDPQFMRKHLHRLLVLIRHLGFSHMIAEGC